jgi:hypothetical protein
MKVYLLMRENETHEVLAVCSSRARAEALIDECRQRSGVKPAWIILKTKVDDYATRERLLRESDEIAELVRITALPQGFNLLDPRRKHRSPVLDAMERHIRLEGERPSTGAMIIDIQDPYAGES